MGYDAQYATYQQIIEQALERARPDETNKGREAALTAAEMARLLRVL